jgi:ABC-type Fe3+ transport system permease subunit
MGAFFKVLKQEKDMQFIFFTFAVLILLGIGCAIFAIQQSIKC